MRAGTAAAAGHWVIMADADGSYDLSDLDAIYRQLRAGAHLVIGDRFAGGIAPGAMPALHRHLGNPVLSAIGRRVSGTDIRDMHCGLRGFHRQTLRALGLDATGMELATEMILRAAAAGHTLTQAPVRLRPAGRSGPSHLRPVPDALRHLRVLAGAAAGQRLHQPRAAQLR